MVAEANARIRINAKAVCAAPSQTTSAFAEKYQPPGMGAGGRTVVCYGVDFEKLKALGTCTRLPLSNLLQLSERMQRMSPNCELPWRER
jgi:hypothetical protein